MKKYLPQSFNDLLAAGLVVLISILWLAQACSNLSLPPEVTGALIVTWTLIIQFYFRKRKEES